MCVWMWAFAGASGPEPGQVPTQILCPFKRTPTYSHSCLEGFYKWTPQTSVLGSRFRTCTSLIQSILSRVISSGSAKNFCPLKGIAFFERYCFIWAVCKFLHTWVLLYPCWFKHELGWNGIRVVLRWGGAAPASGEAHRPYSCMATASEHRTGGSSVLSDWMSCWNHLQQNAFCLREETLPNFCTSWWAGPLLFHPCSYFLLSHA